MEKTKRKRKKERERRGGGKKKTGSQQTGIKATHDGSKNEFK